MPEPARSDAALLRTALLDQLGHLVDEMEAMKPFAGRLSLEARQSVKELYGSLAQWDKEVILPFARRMMGEDSPSCAAAAPDPVAWNDKDFESILCSVQEARRALLAFCQGLSPEAWTRTGEFNGSPCDVYGLLHQLTQRNTDVLRRIAQDLRRRS